MGSLEMLGMGEIVFTRKEITANGQLENICTSNIVQTERVLFVCIPHTQMHIYKYKCNGGGGDGFEKKDKGTWESLEEKGVGKMP